MKVSVILCSYGRPEQVTVALKRLDHEGLRTHDGELILVHSAEDTATGQAMCDFAKGAPYPVSVFGANKRGLSVARNIGISKARGEVVVFDDDDCYQEPGYVAAIWREMGTGEFHYGGGAIVDAEHSVGGRPHQDQRIVINPSTLMGAGFISGNNMFFRKAVFDQLGGFREDMGASSGTAFMGAEDWEMTMRCSLAGLRGIIVPDAIVIHDHGRNLGSDAHEKTMYAYDVGAGSIYALLLARGVNETWPFWGSGFKPGPNREMSRAQLRQLQRQFHGASEYLDYILKNDMAY